MRIITKVMRFLRQELGSGRGLTCRIIQTFTWSDSDRRYEIRASFELGTSQAQFQSAGISLY